ncbi:transmembrane protein 2 [Plakobranchus ocellatus]|uniref:Transmembrane protein 2 n=1 Tax=Plakobranchus ocellatus TaxID=259542 RepID=A0AAV3YBN0_9GAST|nr:transmembrane protein 2 [Plakobranchus ocellatus]
MLAWSLPSPPPPPPLLQQRKLLLYRTTSKRHGFPLLLVVAAVAAAAVAVLPAVSAQVQCPDYEVDCDLWSDAPTWSGNTVPGDGDVVTVDKCILLDTDTANLGGITITPTGSLVFEPGSGSKLKQSPIGDLWREGIVAVVINPENGVVRATASFNVGSSSEYWFNRDSERLVSLMSCHVLMMAAQRNAISTAFNSTDIFEAVEKALYCKVGKSRLRHLQYKEAWVAIAVKEQPWRTRERVGRNVDRDGFRTATLDLMMPWLNSAFYVSSKIHYSRHWSYDRRLVAGTFDAAAPIINVTGDVQSWKAGEYQPGGEEGVGREGRRGKGR